MSEPTHSPHEQADTCSRCGSYADDASTLNQPASDHRFADHDALCAECIRQGNCIELVQDAFEKRNITRYDPDDDKAVWRLTKERLYADDTPTTKISDDRHNTGDHTIDVTAARVQRRSGMTTDLAVAYISVRTKYGPVFGGPADRVYAAISELVNQHPDHEFHVHEEQFRPLLDD